MPDYSKEGKREVLGNLAEDAFEVAMVGLQKRLSYKLDRVKSNRAKSAKEAREVPKQALSI